MTPRKGHKYLTKSDNHSREEKAVIIATTFTKIEYNQALHVTFQEKGGPKMQDTETDDKSNKGRASMKADKKYRKPKIQNPEYEKTKAGRKN